MTTAPRVLLSTVSPVGSDDLRSVLEGAGFAIVDHARGSSPMVDFDGVVAAVIDAGPPPEAAVAQTKRWRLERGDERIPVLWLLPSASDEWAAAGLEAGADAVLARPLDAAVLLAQVRALARAHAATARLSSKAAEARLLGEQLRKGYHKIGAEATLAGHIQRLCLPRDMPQLGAATIAACHRPRGSIATDFYDIRRLDEHHVGFYLGNIMGQGAITGSLLAILIHQTARLKEISESRYRLLRPDLVLTEVNRQLLALHLDDPPLVAMLVGILDARDGTISLSRAGLPAPVYLPADGPATPWSIPGPFLGAGEVAFETTHGTLQPGDRLLIGSDGTRVESDANALIRAAARNREQMGQSFAETVAAELLPQTDQREDFTLVVLEMAKAREHSPLPDVDPFLT